MTTFLFVPSGWPMHLCSVVSSPGYQTEAESQSAAGVTGGKLKLSVLQSPVYNDETVTLRVERTDPNKEDQPLGSCADIYSVSHMLLHGSNSEAASYTRFDALRTVTSHQVPSYTPEQMQEDKTRPWQRWKYDFLRPCNIQADQTAVKAEMRASELASLTRIEWRAVSKGARHAIFLDAPAHYDVLDADTLMPNWGDTTEGIRAGLSVDHSTLNAGEEVRIHMRWENVSASTALGQTEYGEPAPELEIRDGGHRLLQVFSINTISTGHGWGPFTISQGKIQRSFRILTTGTPLPDDLNRLYQSETYDLRLQPGTYYLTTIWSPVTFNADSSTDTANPGTDHPSLGGKYATARSLPVRIDIVPNSSQ